MRSPLHRPFYFLSALCTLYVALCTLSVSAQDLTGRIDLESRLFPNSGLIPGQHGSNASISAEPELYLDWNDGYQSLTITPFARFDLGDSRRTHFDIREAYWLMIANTWELKVGFNKVFWGVTESQHLVDVINQTDLVEAPDGEDKLGQPMIQWTWLPAFGTIDVFVMPLFRERTFPGSEGRLRFPFPIAVDPTIRHERIDLAARWFQPISIFDIGVSHFWGTSREPRFAPLVDDNNELSLIPVYDTINQTGLEIQATFGGWLLKVESILRSGQGDTFGSIAGGFEYTFGNVANSGADIGLLAEYHYDSRGSDFEFAPLDPTFPTPLVNEPISLSSFENDLFLGSRLALNDVQSTAFLGGGIIDMDSGTTSLFAEASRRIGNQWTISLEARGFTNIDEADPFYFFRKDSYFELLISYFY
ncbi:MAG: hypothetical protein KTR29_10140 [Rhodothermaceae bacterium]|nr:hypothetical protein [Rhodothermaceae bacterium]